MIVNQQLLENWQIQDSIAPELIEHMQRSSEVVAILDADLNYLAANEAACRLLRKSESEMVGHNLLELFPQLTASSSHRVLLQAISTGTTMYRIPSDGTFTREGAKYSTDYYPLLKEGKTRAVLAVTRTVYYP